MADKDIQKGDQVSWQWSSGRPGGTAAEIATEGEIAIQSKRGNTIKKNADADNPAVHIERPGNDVVKRASELDVEEKKSGPPQGAHAEKTEEKQTNGTDQKEDESRKGEKRKHDHDDVDTDAANNNAKTNGEKSHPTDPDSGEKDAKKQKTNGSSSSAPKQPEEAAQKKKPGRPKKGDEKPKPSAASGDKKDSKTRGPVNGDTVGSRTRSKT
ncbi:MAG: hypothetical protein M1819_003963 [Sarea resinae]|nr:MAG: hypothetical protein M1819_003963 [Sarea resinae]